MTEGQSLFTLDYERFNQIRGENNLFELRKEFNRGSDLLSQSLLISQETSDSYWLLVDFENQRTYDIRKEDDTTVEVYYGVDIGKRTDILSGAGTIVPRLRDAIGTHKGLIDTLNRLNFNTVDLDNLKRTDLSTRKLSFEAVYSDLEVAYKMLEEILTAPRAALISLPEHDIQQLKEYVLQFYEMTQKIVGFGVGEREKNIREQYVNLSQEIHQFCEDIKQSLLQIASYLSSRRVNELVTQVNDTLVTLEERYNTTISEETDRLLKVGEEAQQQTAEIVQRLEETHLKYQNQLTEKPISQYKEVFENQAKKHEKTAWVWLWITVGLTLISGGIFWWILKDLLPTESALSVVLPNLLAKGFFLSLIYLLLNRSIKNYTAEKHLEVINTHRQNALETVDPFLNAVEGNRGTRDEMLLAATRTIFDANQSGYLSTKTSGSDSANPAQQIIKEVIPTKSSGKDD